MNNEYVLLGGPKHGERVLIIGDPPPELYLGNHFYTGASIMGVTLYISHLMKPESAIVLLIEGFNK